MQKAKGMLPSWGTTKTQSKKGFDKVWAWADKLGAPVNRLTNRIGSEAFWPTTLDKESDKAARILRSFCKDGFYTEDERPANQDGPKQKQRVLKKIPQKVIENAVGLAIFTTMRTGLWISGAGGSGVLVARKEDGTWSPPSGILLHTAGLGFLVGVDIYDCVLVINNRKALESFTKIRATLGGEISAVAGPVGAGGVLENDGKWKELNRPVFTYLKSRGFYAGVQVDGSIIIERGDENARFYGETIGAADILAGKVRHAPPEIKMLMETLKAAEGRSDVDAELMEELRGQPAPGDVNVDAPGDGKIFGIPEADDPDPFGALALEKEGLEIREAGTGSRPSSRQFEYNPSPSSPVYAQLHRRSMDAPGKASRDGLSSPPPYRARSSTHSYSDAGVQTEDEDSLKSPISLKGFNHRKMLSEDYTGTYSPTESDVSAAASTRRISIRGPPPPLPPRSPITPVKQEFEDVDLDGAGAEVTQAESPVLETAAWVGEINELEGHVHEAASDTKENTVKEDGEDHSSSPYHEDIAEANHHSPPHTASEAGNNLHSIPGSFQ